MAKQSRSGSVQDQAAVEQTEQAVPKQVETRTSKTTATPGQALTLSRPERTDGSLGTQLATVAAAGLAVALIEVDWIPGLLIGAAAWMAPNLLPRVGEATRPLVKGAVRAGYSVVEGTRETVAEASEQFQDIVAEVRAESGRPHIAASGPATSRPEPEAAGEQG